MYNIDQPNQHDDGSYTALSNLVQLNQGQTILYRISLSNTTISPFTTTTASPTADVSVNVTWTFSNGTNVTNVVMVIKNLQSAQWAAIGLGQSQKMVNITRIFLILFAKIQDRFILRIKRKDLP
jgi:hypothetical protein